MSAPAHCPSRLRFESAGKQYVAILAGLTRFARSKHLLIPS